MPGCRNIRGDLRLLYEYNYKNSDLSNPAGRPFAWVSEGFGATLRIVDLIIVIKSFCDVLIKFGINNF